MKLKIGHPKKSLIGQSFGVGYPNCSVDVRLMFASRSVNEFKRQTFQNISGLDFKLGSSKLKFEAQSFESFGLDDETHLCSQFHRSPVQLMKLRLKSFQ